MRRSSRAPSVLVAGLVAVLGCQKANNGPAKPDVPEPADLIATISVDSAKDALGRFAEYADGISPGAGSALSETLLGQGVGMLIGVPKLSGIDFGKPVFVLVLDPKKHPHPCVLAATASDAKAVQGSGADKVAADGDRVIVGNAAEVDAVNTYASALLKMNRAPSSLTLSVSPSKLLGLYKTEIDGARAELGKASATMGGMGKFVEGEIDLMLKVADQTERVDLIVDARKGDASFDMAFVPKAGSTFDKFNRVQKVIGSDKLLALLPARSDASMAMVGHYEMGAARQAMLDLMAGAWEQITGAKMDMTKWNAFLDGFDGEMAMLASSSAQGGFSIDEVFGAADGAKSATQLRELLTPAQPGPKTAEIMGIKLTWEAKGNAATHDGVAIDRYTMTPDYASMNDLEREALKRAYGDSVDLYAAGFDKTFAIALGAGGADRMNAIIDGVRKGKEADLPAALKAEVDAGKGRNASVIMYMDMMKLMAGMTGGKAPAGGVDAGISAELGFEDGTLHFRFIYPAATAKAIVGSIMR